VQWLTSYPATRAGKSEEGNACPVLEGRTAWWAESAGLRPLLTATICGKTPSTPVTTEQSVPSVRKWSQARAAEPVGAGVPCCLRVGRLGAGAERSLCGCWILHNPACDPAPASQRHKPAARRRRALGLVCPAGVVMMCTLLSGIRPSRRRQIEPGLQTAVNSRVLLFVHHPGVYLDRDAGDVPDSSEASHRTALETVLRLHPRDRYRVQRPRTPRRVFERRVLQLRTELLEVRGFWTMGVLTVAGRTALDRMKSGPSSSANVRIIQPTPCLPPYSARRS